MLKLVGPVARKAFMQPRYELPADIQVVIEIWTVRDQEDRWHRGNKEKLRKLALEAYEKRPASAPNPALVPLDPDEEGGPFVYALIKLEMPNVTPGAGARS